MNDSQSNELEIDSNIQDNIEDNLEILNDNNLDSSIINSNIELGSSDNINNTAEELELFDNNIETLNENILEPALDSNIESTDSLTDYSIFSYDSGNTTEDIDIDNIIKNIIDIDRKYPELKIIEVYNSKYKKNYSIDEIAKSLSMDKKDVINSLNEIISVI